MIEALVELVLFLIMIAGAIIGFVGVIHLLGSWVL